MRFEVLEIVRYIRTQANGAGVPETRRDEVTCLYSSHIVVASRALDTQIFSLPITSRPPLTERVFAWRNARADLVPKSRMVSVHSIVVLQPGSARVSSRDRVPPTPPRIIGSRCDSSKHPASLWDAASSLTLRWLAFRQPPTA